MTSRLGFLVGLMACLGMGCREQPAVRIILSFPDFKPGCVQMVVQDAGDARVLSTQTFVEELAPKGPGGAVKVAAFPTEDWGKRITVTATAFEQVCEQGPRFTTESTVDLGSGITPVDLTLDAVDGDGDGYASRASGGTDCVDGDASVKPGVTELCNGRDDNCDNRVDEGFERVGQQCGTGGTCQTWACNGEGALSCQTGTLRWYRDQDGDGEGTPLDSKESCAQPQGYVLNNRDCDDTQKTRSSTADELCNAVDDNCNNVTDEGFNVGAACTEGTCGGKVECTSVSQSACKAVTSTWYPDDDQDTYGKKGAGKSFCGNTQPTGHVARGDDCDDTKASVNPGAQELCDSVDNNCDNRTDEGFDVGVACAGGNDCPGKKACAASGTTTECTRTTEPTQYYVDNDQDTYGKDLGPLTCVPPAGYVAQGGDCQDGNRFIYPNAAELCDREDNDCNPATPQDAVCPTGGGSWKDYSSGSGDDWRSVALYANGGVWVAGGDKLQRRQPGQSNFENIPGCAAGADVYSIAANPINGDALLGGNEGFLARYSSAANNCPDKGKQGIDTDIRGVHLVPVQGESLPENHLVGANTVLSTNLGRAVRVFDNQGRGYDNQPVSDELKDVNGPSRTTLFAVGGSSGLTPSSRIYRFNNTSGDWDEETILSGGGPLQGVWVVHPKLAYAVGDAGTLLTWNGTTWSKVIGAPNQNLSSVVAFGTQSIYVTTLLGELHYYNGSSWTKLFNKSGVQFLDIAASDPGNIWVVGTKGTRYHWPD